MSGAPACGYCHTQAVFMVVRDEPGGNRQAMSVACRSHIAVAAEKTAQSADSASVTVYLLNARTSVLGDGSQPAAGDILERVRRIGAFSAKHPDIAHQMEDALYLAVLVMIAHGAQGASGLASAALTSRRYGFERECG